MNIHELKRKVFIQTPVEEVFLFFSRAENLNRITPPWLGFKIQTPLPIRMEKATVIEYSIRLGAVPMRWRTEIDVWNPPACFVDRQIKGPYRLWIHEHRFFKEGKGTIMEDTVHYAVPGGLAEPLVHKLFVRPRLVRIFDYRAESIKEIFRSL